MELWKWNHSYGSVTIVMEVQPLLWKCNGAREREWSYGSATIAMAV